MKSDYNQMKQQESLVNSNLSAERLRNRIRNNEAN